MNKFSKALMFCGETMHASFKYCVKSSNTVPWLILMPGSPGKSVRELLDSIMSLGNTVPLLVVLG